MNVIENAEEYRIRIDETLNIEIVGAEGLRVFLGIIQSAWDEGQEVKLFANEVRFTPKNNKPEHINFTEVEDFEGEQNIQGQEV